jgi:hypothetical protein
VELVYYFNNLICSRNVGFQDTCFKKCAFIFLFWKSTFVLSLVPCIGDTEFMMALMGLFHV